MRRGIWIVAVAVGLTGVGLGVEAGSAVDDSPPVRLDGEGSLNVRSKAAEVVVINDSGVAWTLELQASVEAPPADPDADDAEPVDVPVQITVDDQTPLDNSRDPSQPLMISDVALPQASSASDGTVTVEIDLPAEQTGAGELVVVATPDGTADATAESIVMRRAIVTTESAPVPAVSSVAGFSSAGAPLFSHAGEVTAYVPLESAGPCPAIASASDDTSATSTTGRTSTTLSEEVTTPSGDVTTSAPTTTTTNTTAVPTTTTTTPVPTTLGEVTLTDGDHAITASVSCSTDESTAGGRGAALRVVADEVPSGDEYKGTLTLGEEEVAVTISRSDCLFWALLTMALGFGTAYLSRQLPEVRRPRWVLKSRLTRAGQAATNAQAAVNVRLANMGLAADRHSIAEPVTAEVASLVGRLEAVPSRWFRHPSEEDVKEYGAIAASAATFTALSTDWKKLPEKLSSLVTIRATDGYVSGVAPQLDAAAASLLAPAGANRTYTSTAARDLLDEIDALEAVFKLVPSVVQAGERLGAYDSAPVGFEDLFSSAKARLNTVESLLEQALVAKPLVVGGMATKVADLRLTLMALPDPPPPPVVGVMGLAGAVGTPPPLMGPLAPLDQLVAHWAREVDRTEVTLLYTNVVLFVVAAAIALWTGLEAKYFGKAWGSWVDYGVLFFWAAAGTTTVSSILDAVKRFGDRRFSAEVVAPK